MARKNVKNILTKFLGVAELKNNYQLESDLAEYILNCKIENNMLLPGISYKRYKSDYDLFLPMKEKVVDFQILKNVEIQPDSLFEPVVTDAMFVTGERLVYQADIKNGVSFFNLTSMNFPVNCVTYRMEGKNCIITGHKKGTKGIGSYDGEYTITYELTPSVDNLCVHYGRLFAKDVEDGFTLIFSKLGDPRIWDMKNGAGKITLDNTYGEIEEIVSYNDKLYCFMKRAVFRINANADALEFSVKRSFEMADVIEGTITKWADKIIFSTAEGLFLTDGYTVVKAYNFLDSFIAKCKKLIRVQVDGANLLLSMHTNLSEGKGINTLFIINSVANSIEVEQDFSVHCLRWYDSDEKSKLVFFDCKDREGFYELQYGVGRSGKKVWKSNKLDFGVVGQKKRIKKIYIESNVSVWLNIYVDGKQFNFIFYNGEVLPNIVGYNFVFEIVFFAEKFEIKIPTVEYEIFY